MNPAQNSETMQVLREWLRNDRRLGMQHWPVAPEQLRPATIAGLRTASAGERMPVGRLSDAIQSTPDRRPAEPVVAGSAAPGAARRTATATPSVAPSVSRSSPAEVRPPTISAGAVPSSRPVAPIPLTFATYDDAGMPPMCDRELSESEARAELAKLDAGWVKNCTRCPLHAQGRQQTVFGVGHVRPQLVFVGEGPGADEDRQGEPFVGRAGQLLTKMIQAMTLSREQVYICNIVKCRPPGNRTPVEEEMTACSPYLFRQLAILRPKVIVTLGAPASQTLLATKTPISRLRGAFHEFPPPALGQLGLPKVRLMPTFHPAYLLRSPQEKGKAWDDLKQVMGELGLQLPAR